MQRAAEELKCTVPEVQDLPVQWKFKAIAAAQAKDKGMKAKGKFTQQRFDHKQNPASVVRLIGGKSGANGATSSERGSSSGNVATTARR